MQHAQTVPRGARLALRGELVRHVSEERGREGRGRHEGANSAVFFLVRHQLIMFIQ